MSSRFALVRGLAVVAVFAFCFAAGSTLGEDEQPAGKRPATERSTVALGSYTLAPAPALPDLRAVPRKREPQPAPPAPASEPLAPPAPPAEAPTVIEAPAAPAEPPPPASPPAQEPSTPEPTSAPDPAPDPAPPMPSPDAAPGAGGSGHYDDDGGSR
jgi:type IV secretory pathway VirB10-like protein